MANDLAQLTALIEALAAADWKTRDDVKAELLAAAAAHPDRTAALDFLEEAKKSLALEVRWEVDEVLEELAPVVEPEPEPEPEPEDPNAPLKASDLQLVFDDPRGIRVYKSKKGERWFLSQVDPYSGQPRTMELHPQEVAQLKTQFAGSPYWVLGSGATPTL